MNHTSFYDKKIVTMILASMIVVIVLISCGFAFVGFKVLGDLEVKHAAQIKEETIKYRKAYIQNAVNRIIDTIDLERKLCEKITENTPDPNSFTPGSRVVPECSQAAIQANAIQRVRATRLENNGYIWVNKILDYGGGDNYGIRLVHPNLPKSEGMFLSTRTTDIRGNTPYLTELEGVKQKGELFFDYWFKKMDSEEIKHKITFAKLYRDYDWVIATGVYLDDIAQIVRQQRDLARKAFLPEIKKFIIFLLSCLFAAIILALFLNRRLRKAFLLYTRQLTEKDRELVDLNENLLHQVAEQTHDLVTANERLQQSEQNFRALIEKSPLPMVVIGPQQNIVLLNERFTELFGYTSEDITTTEDWWMAAYPDEEYRVHIRRSWEEAIERAVREKTDVGMKVLDIRVKDHSVRTCEFYMMPLEELSLVVMNDISERLRAAEKLMESEELFRALFEQAGGYCMILQPTENGIPTILAVNEAACLAHGYTREEMVGRPVADLDDEDGKRRCRERTEYILSGKTLQIENVHIRKDGSAFPVAVFAKVVHFDGRPPLIVSTEFDISEQKKAEEEKLLLERKLQQAQKMEAIGTLAGGIAHDFNNILTSIIGFTEMGLEETLEGSELRENLEEVYLAGNRARDLVRQILAFARHSDESIGPVKPAILIKEALKLLRPSTPSTIEIVTRLESDSFVMGNPTQLHQVIMNLCTNSIQAMQATGGVLKIGLVDIDISLPNEVSEDGPGSGESGHPLPGKYLEISVADNGPGIDKPLLDKIFDPYFTTKAMGEGTGMGLAVVAGIIESYGGHISVTSEPGHQTIFSLCLPVTDTVSEVMEENMIQESDGSGHILLVDDEPSLIKMAGRLLASLGYTVTTSSSGEEALQTFREASDQFDLVLTDMTMPHMTGDILAEEVRKIRTDIPIILCTGYSTRMSDERAREMGINGFFFKPYTKTELARTIHSVLAES